MLRPTLFSHRKLLVASLAMSVVLARTLRSPIQAHRQTASGRMLFDWMVTGGILAMNPASSVRGPKYVIKKGKTPVLTPEEARQLLDSIDATELKGCATVLCSPSWSTASPESRLWSG
jgi:site-specific recombinase XerC